MFEFLFKYPAQYFATGKILSMLPWWQWALLPLAIAALAFVALGYFRLRARTRARDRAAIALMRALAIALILFSLSRPLLEVTAQAPRPGSVGVLLDNSISMQLRGQTEAARADFIRQQFDDASGGLLRDLRHRFDVRLFSFGAGAESIDSIDALDFDDGGSDLAQALDVAQQSLEGVPLAGLVLITDGALQSSEALEETLLNLRSRQVRVYSLGLGEKRYARDIELSRVSLPDRVLNGSKVMADVAIRQQGYDGQPVELLVEDDSRILHKQQLRLRPGVQSYRIPLAPGDAGARRLEFRLAPIAGERIAANNSRQAVVAVDDRRVRILHFEGEPRFELKFIRRAVADDENLAVSGLIRTADAKFYRVGIASREELRNGFPNSRDELFSYDVIILGSVEISLLSLEQQQMIVDFVSQRGGALLLLGGRHAFSEGGYRDSVLHEISPVVMPQQARPEFSRRVRIQPTDAAWVHPALLIADSSEKSIARWLSLPPLTIVNPIRELKPGATLLLRSPANDRGEYYVALAWHRYGRGKVVAFPVQNSWLWQMHHEIDLDDPTHELLWRQLLRWMAESVPRRLSLSVSAHQVHTDAEIGLRAEVLNPDFTPRVDASPSAILTAPDGSETIVPLAPHPTLAGAYQASARMASPGDYLVRVEIDEDGKIMRSAETRFRVSPDGDEFFHSEMNEQLLRRIADETGGGFFGAADAGGLADALDDGLAGAPALVRHELWDMPLLFLLLVLLLGSEWGYRRWRGLA